MQNQNERKVIDPVVDQKVIPQKSNARGIWWLLLAILLILLAVWYGMHKNAMDDNANKPTAAPAPTEQVAPAQAERSAEADQSATEVTPSAVDGSALAKLQSYFIQQQSTDSEWINLDKVNFAVGSATPQVDNGQQLDEIVQLLAQHPDNNIVIRGYTDSTGPQRINDPLSDQRANAMKQWLTAHNIDADRISIEGQGASQAVADNDTATGRDQNRRVALQIKAAE